MQIKKSDLRKAVREHLQMWMTDNKPLGMISMRGTLEPANNEEIEVDKEALDDAIKETLKHLEADATLRMQAEAAGVKNTGDVERDSVKDATRKVITENSGADSLTEATKWYDAIKRPVKVGDRVHVGHKQKGGAGIEGIVTKINKDGTIELRGTGSEKHRTFRGKLKNTAILEISGVDSLKPNDPHTPEDEAEKDAADDVMEADPKAKKGRPRGAPHIENVRFWDLPESSLKYIIADASDAVKRLPMARKAGKWADEVNDAVTVLHWRKKKGITVEESKDETKKGKIRKRPWVSGLDPAGGIAEAHGGSHKAKEMKVKDKEGFAVDTEGKQDVGRLAKTPKSKALVKKMYDMVSKKLKLKSIEDVQPVKDGIAFIFGDPKDAKKMATHLKNAGSLGKVMKLAAGGGNRTLVSLKT